MYNPSFEKHFPGGFHGEKERALGIHRVPYDHKNIKANSEHEEQAIYSLDFRGFRCLSFLRRSREKKKPFGVFFSYVLKQTKRTF